MLQEQRRRQLAGVVAAVAGPALVTGIGLLAPLQGRPGVSALYLLAIAGTTAVGGLGAGLLAAALSYLCVSYYFLGPVGSFRVDSDNLAAAVIFPVAAVFVVLLLTREIRVSRIARQALADHQQLITVLEESEERARSVLESTVDGIVVIDEAGLVQVFNPASERLFGYRADDVIGRNVAMLMPEPDRSQHDSYLDQYLRTGQAKVIGIGREVLGLRSDGTTFPFDLSISEVRLGGRRLFTGVVHDLTDRKRIEAVREEALERERFLAEATQLLGSSLDCEKTLSELARLAVSRLADWCTVEIYDDRGTIESVAIAHVDPAKVELAAELRRRYPLDQGSSFGLPHVIRTGRPELYPYIPDELLVENAVSEEQLEVARSLGVRSAMIVPLPARGRVLGAITFVAAESGRLYKENDLRFAEELARRAALAIDHARLHDLERSLRQRAERASERTERLQKVSAALSQALTPAEVAEVLIDQGGAALGAAAVWASVLTEGGEEVELLGQTGYSPSFVDAHRRIPITAPLAVVQTVKDGQARWYGTAEELPSMYPELAESQAATGSQGLAVLPLARRSRPFGFVAFRFREPREFSAEDRALLTAVVGQCSEALERARLYEQEHRIAETLQRSILPERLPELERAALAGRYIPGSPGLEVGGDWYDALIVTDGWLAISIGDVVGRGVQAASVMGQLRNALRAYVQEGYGPAEALARLNRLVENGDEWFSTLVLVLFDPRTGFVRFANAGHPPPLLLSPQGRARLLEGGRSVPLGALPDARYEEETFILESGSTLVLYTDGLVESPDIPLDEGLSRLVHAATEAPDGLDHLLEHLLESLVSHRRRADDVALLALRAMPEEVSPPLCIRVPAEPTALASIRGELQQWLAQLELGAGETNHILVACGEACTNAIEHSTSGHVEVEARADGRAILIVVRDGGHWKEPRPRRDRGLGLNLMEAFMDEVDVRTGPEGTEVRMVRRLPQEALTR